MCTEILLLNKGDRKLLYPSAKESGASVRDVAKHERRSLYDTLIKVEKQGMKRLTLALPEFRLHQDVFVEKVRLKLLCRIVLSRVWRLCSLLFKNSMWINIK